MKSALKVSWLLLASWLLCCCIAPQRIVLADDPPPTPPVSPTEVNLPRDNEKSIPQDGSNGWTKITTSEKDGRAVKVLKAKYIVVKLKKKGDHFPPEDVVFRKIGYYSKSTGKYVEADVTSVASKNGNKAQIEIPADAKLDQPIYVKVQTQDHDDHSEVVPAETVNKNFSYLYDGGDTLISIGHGGGVVCSVDGEGGETTLLELAEQVGLSASDFETPDLMFWCTDIIETGVLLFSPVGQFEFGSVPHAIHVFDVEGVDLVNAGDIELGDAYITPRGDVAIPVLNVSEDIPAFGMIVRGVEVDMHDDADANSVHCYTTGGTSLRFLEGDTCPIAQGTRVLENWEPLSWSANYSLSGIVAPVGEEETATIDNGLVTTVSEDTNSGYLDAIVIEGDTSNAIKNGKVVLRAISGWQFEMEAGRPDTKLYILNADTGADLYHKEISASLTVNSHGDLIVTLGNIETYCSSVRVKLVIAGVHAAYTAPIPWGVGYKLECYGSSLKAPLRLPQVILEGESPDISDPSGHLPQVPIAITGWTPVASSE